MIVISFWLIHLLIFIIEDNGEPIGQDDFAA